jgi:Arc/MetJ-type ribon-helix-helix transcriptional regulator
MRNTKAVTISLAPEQLKRAQRLAKRQSRTMSELFREGLRRLEQDEQQKPRADLVSVLRLIRQSAKDAGLDTMTPREINAEVHAARRERIAKAGSSRRG